MNVLQSCLDILPEKVQRNNKSYEFHLFKNKEFYIIDYVSSGQACFYVMGRDLYQVTDRMIQVLKYHQIIK